MLRRLTDSALSSWKGLLSGLAMLLLVPQATPASNVLHEADSVYNHISIHQNGSERCMIFGKVSGKEETCLNMENLLESVFEYTGMMFTGFVFTPETKRMLLFGLGGGYLPLVLREKMPEIELVTVEIDPLVVDLARKHFYYQEGPKQKTVVMDGRQYLRRNTEKWDQIWMDAFTGEYIPAHMTTKEFLELAKERLSPGGVLVTNTHFSHKLFEAQVHTHQKVFKHVWIFKGRRTANAILVATDADTLPETHLKAVTDRFLLYNIPRVSIQAEFRKLEITGDYSNAPVLTDDYSPANLLIQQKSTP